MFWTRKNRPIRIFLAVGILGALPTSVLAQENNPFGTPQASRQAAAADIPLGPESEEQITLALENADIKELVRWAAEHTQKNIIIHPDVKGQVTVISGAPLSREEAYETFLSTLQAYGYAVISSGRALEVVPSDVANQSGAALLINGKKQGVQDDDVVVQIFKVNNISAAQLATLLKPMLPNSALLTPYPDSNMLLVSARAKQIERLPTRHGERVVMRLLDKGTGRLDLSILGMTDNDLARFENILAQPHGVILVTGPTGSGKSTSLYAGLSALNDGSRNILTIEDPVEYDLEGIGQMQVNTKAGMTFAKGLRAILRQDPDIVMIGEIRDGETADIAIQASLTGHLLLSTLHTNTAVGSITRLIDMGVEPFLVSSSLLAMIAQRLVRKLCPQCKEPYSPDAATRQRLRCDLHEQLTFYHARGCEHCFQHGYKGRTGIYEIVRVTDDLRTLIHTRASEQELSLCARKTSADIFSDGLYKVKAGITSVDELLRVVHAN